MNKDQNLTFELLLILGVVLLLISPIGQWLAGLVSEIVVPHKINLTLNPFDQSPTTATTGGPTSLVGHYTVPLAGGGSMTVNASDPNAARQNVIAEGGTPA